MSLGLRVDVEGLLDRSLDPEVRTFVAGLDSFDRLTLRSALVAMHGRYASAVAARACRFRVDDDGTIVWWSVWEPPPIGWRA